MSDLLGNIDRAIDKRKLKIDGTKQDDTIFKYTPVDFKTFVESKEFCGSVTLTSRQIEASYAILYGMPYAEFQERKDKAINIFENLRFNLAVLQWGKGSGKDLLCALMTLYVAYFLLCCKSPQQMLGFPESEPLDIVNVAYSADQAKTVFFEKLKQAITHNQWFRKYFTVNLSGANISEKTLDMTSDDIIIGSNAILFPHLIRLFSKHSDQESSEGLNILMFTMDEADAFKSKTQARNAQKIFNMLQTSAESRFGLKHKGLLISYPRTDKGFMAKMLALSKNDLHMYADTAFTWEVKAELYAKSPRFNFDVIKKLSDGNSEKKTYSIPMDFKSFFDRNPTDAKTMYMCMPPGAESPFIEYIDKLMECVDMKRIQILESEEYIEGGETKRRITKWNTGLPDINYVVSIDLGEKHDKGALSIMHREGGVAFHDLSVSWHPIDKDGKKTPVSLSNIREFVVSLRARMSFIVIFDKWQSSLMIQDFRNAGIGAETISTSNIKDYNDFLQFLYTKRIVLLNHDELLEEIQSLERDDKGRVDHTADSQNDITDTIVRALKSLFKEELVTSEEQGEFIGNNLNYMGGENITESNL